MASKRVSLDEKNSTVRFAVEGMRVDLGGIAKGYAIDLAIDVITDSGAAGAMVDVGGDIRCYGKPAGKTHWHGQAGTPGSRVEVDVGASFTPTRLQSGAIDIHRFAELEDRADKDSNNVKYEELSTTLSFDVTKARKRSCNKNK